MKVPTGVTLTDMATAWGLVQVYGKDGEIEREFSITAKEADAVAQGNNVLPPGVTDEEWFSGRAVVCCRPCNQGEAVINPDGTLVVNFGVDEKDGRVDVKLMLIPPEEYTKVGEALHIEQAVAVQVDVARKEIAPEVKGR